MLISFDLNNIDTDYELVSLLYNSEEKINKTKIAEQLNVSRPTIIKRFKTIENLPTEDLQDIPNNSFIGLDNNDIKLYIFLSLCYYAHHLTYKEEIGKYCKINLDANYSNNYKKIKNSLEKLIKLNKIKICEGNKIEVTYTGLNIILSDKNNEILSSTKSYSKSIGEDMIAKLLAEHEINFTREKTFSDLKDKLLLRYDFYVNEEYLIEMDGIQHFRPDDFFGGEAYYNKLKEHDNLKNQYAKDNNIPLIRIPYNALKNLTYEDICINSKYQL